MKKNLIILLSTLCVSFFGYGSMVFAQSNSSFDAFLSSIVQGFGNFGYRMGANISVQSLSSTGVTIQSPVILNESSQDVLKYVLWYGPYPFSQLLDGGSTVSTSDFVSKTFEFSSHTGSTFTMFLGTADGLSPNQTYYATVVPIAQNGESGEMSGPDICFRLQGLQHAVGVNCSTLGAMHNAAGPNMGLANVSNTCNANQITLTWTAIQGAPKVRIYKLLANGQLGTLIAEKNMSDQTHIYTLPNPSSPEVVRFVPIDAGGTPIGTEKDYTLRLCGSTPATPTTTPTPPSITKVPVVGPEQDIAIVLLVSLVVYGIVRYRKYRLTHTTK